MEAVITNSTYLAEVLTKANCTSREKVEAVLEDEVKAVLEDEVKGAGWRKEVKAFEQHMADEEEVRIDWTSGKFENHDLQCPTWGDQNAWGRSMHVARMSARRG